MLKVLHNAVTNEGVWGLAVLNDDVAVHKGDV